MQKWNPEACLSEVLQLSERGGTNVKIVESGPYGWHKERGTNTEDRLHRHPGSFGFAYHATTTSPRPPGFTLGSEVLVER